MTGTPETTDFRFSSEDLEELTDALSRMAVRDHLPKEQWSLLLSIFAAAAGSVKVEDATEGKFPGVKVDGGVTGNPRDKEVKTLREQLRKACMPANPPGKPLKDMISPQKPPTR